MPMAAMRPTAGIAPDGALEKAAIPAGRDRTPAPTMDLTRLKISSGMVAVPPPTERVSSPTALLTDALSSEALEMRRAWRRRLSFVVDAMDAVDASYWGLQDGAPVGDMKFAL